MSGKSDVKTVLTIVLNGIYTDTLNVVSMVEKAHVYCTKVDHRACVDGMAEVLRLILLSRQAESLKALDRVIEEAFDETEKELAKEKHGVDAHLTVGELRGLSQTTADFVSASLMNSLPTYAKEIQEYVNTCKGLVGGHYWDKMTPDKMRADFHSYIQSLSG